jgi:hypothetical protein
MRFLNRKWAHASLKDFDMQLHLSVYLLHLQSLSDDLPPRLRAFAAISAGRGLHDARLIKARLNRKKATLRVVFQLPADADDWLKVRILFSKIDIETLNAPAWKRVCANAESRCLADEVDLAPGGQFEARFLFDPRGETAVQFRRFQMEIETLPEGHLEPHGGWREDE